MGRGVVEWAEWSTGVMGKSPKSETVLNHPDVGTPIGTSDKEHRFGIGAGRERVASRSGQAEPRAGQTLLSVGPALLGVGLSEA
jgi:hypothetical protein